MAKDPIARYLQHRTSRLEQRARLRPMSANEILDLALRVYQNIGLSMLRATVLPALFCFAAVTFVAEYALPGLFVTEHAENTRAQIGEALGTLGIGFIVGGPLFLIGVAYASGVTVFFVSDFVAGRTPSEQVAHAGARKNLGRLFLFSLRELFQAWSGVLAAFAALVAGAVLSDSLPETSMWPAVAAIVAVFGFVVAFFLMPWFLARHALAASAICLENQNPGPAIRRSLDLMRGTGWAPSGYGTVWLLFGVVLLLLLMIWLGAEASLGLLQSVVGHDALASWPVVGDVVQKILQLFPLFLAIWTLIPVWCTTTTLLYFERRIRLEAYDIVSLAQEVWRSDRQSRFEL